MVSEFPYWDDDPLLASCLDVRIAFQLNLVVGDGTVCEGTLTVAVVATQ